MYNSSFLSITINKANKAMCHSYLQSIKLGIKLRKFGTAQVNQIKKKISSI